jgi:hypothetical protein
MTMSSQSLRPTLLGSCGRAATAAESRFRVQYPNSKPRASRVVALDDGAEQILDVIAGDDWNGARFFRFDSEARGTLRSIGPDTDVVSIESQLADADVFVLVSTAEGLDGAEMIGDACRDRGIMTAGIALNGGEAGPSVMVLRPYSSVLVVASDSGYLTEMLTALRA